MVTVNPGLRGETPAWKLSWQAKGLRRGAPVVSSVVAERRFMAKLLFDCLWRVKVDIRIAWEKVVANR